MSAKPFRSFYMAGFDDVVATHHDRRIMEDYTGLFTLGIDAAWEQVRWPIVETGGRFDFSSLDPYLARARYVGLRLVLELTGAGLPEGLNYDDPNFPGRLEAYATAVARHIQMSLDAPHVFALFPDATRIAEMSENWRRLPIGSERLGCLASAAIAAMEAVRHILPDSRFINVDRLRSVSPPSDRPDLDEVARLYNRREAQAYWDMLAGERAPEIGGSPEYLDILGPCFDGANQRELESQAVVDVDDLRYQPLSELLGNVWRRYRREMVLVAPTCRSTACLEWIADEAVNVRDAMIPLLGICLTSAVSPKDSLWTVSPTGTRSLNESVLQAIRYGQRQLDGLEIPRDLQLPGRPHLW